MTKNKVVLVTGGSKRIGKTISEFFHSKGFNIALHYNHSKNDAISLSSSLNKLRKNSCDIYQANLTDPNEINSLIDKVKQDTKKLNVLINNASSFYPTPIETADLDAWHDLSFTNLIAPFLLIQGFKDLLAQENGCVINISDAIATKGIAKFSLYSSAKGGIEIITKSCAKELSPDIRVNAIAPGAILWPEQEENMEKESTLKTIPLGRIGDAKDIASAAFFITQSEYMTGQVIKVDGGRSLS